MKKNKIRAYVYFDRIRCRDGVNDCYWYHIDGKLVSNTKPMHILYGETIEEIVKRVDLHEVNQLTFCGIRKKDDEHFSTPLL